jgi:nucleotidyltransferase/DNA polymerase involved in DNA repair
MAHSRTLAADFSNALQQSSHRPATSAGSGHAARANSMGVHAGSGQGAKRGSRMAACLWLPTFELRLELVRSPDLDSTSVALLAPGESTRRTIWQVSERAWAAGVRPGQLISQAVSLCPSLTLLDPDPAHYDAAVEAILETLVGRTPIVEPGVERGKVFLGMDGLGRLYGSPKNQLRTMLRALFDVLPRPLVASYRVGYAPGTFGAWTAAARATPGGPVVVEDEASLARFLARCPVQALPVETEMVTRLERLNIRTLGDLTRLPEPALVAQFGQDGRDALAWASGRRIDPVRPWHRPRPIRASLEFADATGQSEVWHAALERLVERALARDARRGRSVHEMRIIGHLEGGGSWTVDAILREPTAEKERLAFVLRSRMGLTPPPRALTGLVLEFTDFGAPTEQQELFEANAEQGRTLAEGKIPPSLKDAVRELRLRLGDSPLYRVVELDPWSRIPERRHALLRFEA